MSKHEISEAPGYAKREVAVLDSKMAYVEAGDGAPVVFLHGNPTSSYLWRNVMPYLEASARVIAPDLIGMGDSGASEDGSYRFVDHVRYLDAWLDAVDISSDVTFVVHDWGSALGFHWAHRHPQAVRGIAYMEAIVRPLAGWEQWPEVARAIFQGMRSPAGEEIVLQKNVFVERILPGSVLRKLSERETDEYRRPYLVPGESRRPTLTWPREIPVGGDPADVAEIVGAYAQWLASSPVPKLFVNAEPGTILTGAQREFCRTWPNQTELTVPGLHFIQEDSPHEIGEALRDWYLKI